jgi:5-oxoprolinase (ATP-hydrolysing) subunit A
VPGDQRPQFEDRGQRSGQRPFRCETARVTTSTGRPVDLNADLGEGFGVWRLGDDEALLEVVTSANVACGFHAGDPVTMRRVCARAAARGVAVGAQVSYRDLAGFGRRFIDVEQAELTDDVLYQLAALDGIARVAGTRVSYVKPHGALYNAAVSHERHAQAVIDAVLAYDRRLPVLGLPGSALLRRAEAAGLSPVAEGFADRGYTAAGALVPRREPGALVHDPEIVAERAVRMAARGVVEAVDGTTLPMPVRSVCVHGDTPGAVQMARAVRTAIEAAGLSLRPFAER